MICKWCGATVDVTKGKCSVCGKELPPLSDCGGFYNVAPKAAQANPAPNAEQPASQPVPGPMGQNRTEGPAPNEKSKKRMTILLAAALVLLAAAVVFSIVRSISLSKRIAALEEANADRKLPAATEERATDEIATPANILTEAPTEAPTEATEVPTEETEAPTEATEAIEADFADQNITFTIDKDGNMKIMLNDEEIEDGAFEIDGSDIFLNGMKILYASLEEDTDASTALGRTFVFTYDIYDIPDAGKSVFGTSREVTFVWKYRTEKTGEWQDTAESPSEFLTRELLAVGENEKPHCNLSFSNDLINDNNYFELQCTMTRTSKEGGTLTIVYDFVPEKLPPATNG